MSNTWGEHLKLLPPPVQAVLQVERVAIQQQAATVHIIDKATRRRLATMTASPVALRDAQVLAAGMNQQCDYQRQIRRLEQKIDLLERMLSGELPCLVVRK